MEAANRGAQEPAARDRPEHPAAVRAGANPYITDGLHFEFHYFFMRKFWFAYWRRRWWFSRRVRHVDELFEILTLEQTKKLADRTSIFLYGDDYWNRC
jgi:predicted Rossmann-fold nucleotide-binding protein